VRRLFGLLQTILEIGPQTQYERGILDFNFPFYMRN